MSNDEKTKEENQETPENSDEGLQSETDEKIKAINDETNRIKEALAKNEEAKAKAKLAGVTLSGEGEEKPKEETPQEYRERIEREMAGR